MLNSFLVLFIINILMSVDNLLPQLPLPDGNPCGQPIWTTHVDNPCGQVTTHVVNRC